MTKHNVLYVAEICNECGCSVEPGSGNYVNRVPDMSSPEERADMGRAYPFGDFICAECDSCTSDD
jgi:hypothetical protein